MKYILILLGILFVAPQSAPANTPAYAHCGTYDSYILLYKSIQKFEELGKLRCGESVTITAQDGDFTQVRTSDSRYGWVPTSDLSTTAPAPQAAYTFGWTQKPDAVVDQPANPAPEPTAVQAPVQASVLADALTPAPTTAEAPVPSPPPARAPTLVQSNAEPIAETMIQPAIQPLAQPSEQATVARPSDTAPLLTNVNVMKMQSAHLSPDTIITRLNSSRCDFDTSPAALHRLKQSGVSDRIILAMMHAPAAFSAASTDGAPSVEVKIPDQTPVQVAVSSDVSADSLQEGTVVDMTVVDPVMINGVTVIPGGAEARARIMAVRRSSLGSSGQVVWFMQDVTATTGDHVPASFAAVQDAKAAIGRFAGYPFFLSEYRKGAPAIAASSDHFTALVDGNIPLHVPRSSGVERVAAKPQVQPQPASQATPAPTTVPVFPVIVQTPEEQTTVKP